MKRLMMVSYNRILDETKVSGPYPAEAITHWVTRQRSESALGMVTWELRELTHDEESLPTGNYILKGGK